LRPGSQRPLSHGLRSAAQRRAVDRPRVPARRSTQKGARGGPAASRGCRTLTYSAAAAGTFPDALVSESPASHARVAVSGYGVIIPYLKDVNSHPRSKTLKLLMS